MRVGVAAIVLLAAGAGGWAATTEIAGAVIAPGKLVVDTNSKKVQHPSGGVVGELLVREGSRVRRGDVVVRLDDTQVRASLAVVSNTLDELAARQARNEAERDGADAVRFPAHLVARLAEPDIAALLAGEQRLFEIRHAARQGQKAQLGEQSDQLHRQIEGIAAQEAAKARESELLAQELESVRLLWKQNLVQLARITALERDAARLDGERAALLATVAQTRGRIAELELKVVQIDRDLGAEVGRELAEIRAKRAEFVERRAAAEDQLRRVKLVAPQDGRVFQLAVHTVGGVIQAGEPVLLIVPESEALVAEVRVAPQEIDQVRAGQKTVLRFGAASQRATPELGGEVVHVAADVAQPDRFSEPFYTVRIRIHDADLERLGGLQPMAGMPVDAFIQTDRRTVASYLVRPLADQIARTFRQY